MHLNASDLIEKLDMYISVRDRREKINILDRELEVFLNNESLVEKIGFF